MAVMKTPGVYIVEKSAFPNSVVEVATAVPAFIGYTKKALNGTESLTNKPRKISSMGEYQSFFGGAPIPTFTIDIAKEGASTEKTLTVLTPNCGSFSILVNNEYTLYSNLRLFFANGGGPCYIVSVGDFKSEPKANAIIDAFEILKKEMEPTMIVVPEAINLPEEDCIKIQQAMLKHCGLDMRNRFAILDVFMNKYPEEGKVVDYITPFRTNIGANQLDFGAAYYPWLATSVISDSEITEENIIWSSMDKVIELLNAGDDRSKALSTYISSNISPTKITSIDDAGVAVTEEKEEKDKIQDKIDLHCALLQNWGAYQLILKAIKENLNLLPPSAAMAGLYTMVDNTRGVWKAPANISVNNVIKPTLNITNAEQEDLNVPLTGKAVNAIRSFIGEGVKVWGARTLDGNSLDWRYINVRRTMIYLEESVKNAARAYVFEPNEANTWLNMKCMIDNFLRSVWKRGGLAGTTPEDAYSVHVGLGDTMTGVDILEGIMRITVLVAISRPAEFIEITFQQQMQKS